MQVTLEGGGSWSELARQDATLPADASVTAAAAAAAAGQSSSASSGGRESSGVSGVLGFFGRKKGRGYSPRPKERGVLGKEGARVVVSN